MRGVGAIPKATGFVDMLGGTPIGRPQGVAELAAFVASDRGAFIIGVDYIVDGGTMPTT